jgi:hypothetical protein
MRLKQWANFLAAERRKPSCSSYFAYNPPFDVSVSSGGKTTMAKKSLGYVKLEWVCPNCSTRNLGPQKTCTSCGAPQPDNVEFEQAAQAEIIKEQAEIAKAKVGPDIHCHYLLWNS